MGVEAGVGGQREYLIDMEQEMCMGHRQRERERERELELENCILQGLWFRFNLKLFDN